MKRLVAALGLLVADGFGAAHAAGPPSSLWEDVAHPNRPRCQALVADAQKKRVSRTVDAPAAARLAEEATRLCPDFLPAFVLLGDLRLAALDDAAGARAPLERARQLEDEAEGHVAPDPHLAFEVGLVRAVAGDLDGSLKEYRRALELGGIGRDQSILLYDLGDTYQALGRLDEAIDAYRRAAKLSPQNAMVSFALAVASDRDGREAESRAWLQQALAADPAATSLTSGKYFFLPPADRDYYLALSYRAQGRIAEAKAAIEQFLRSAAESPYAARARELLTTLQR